MLRGGHAELWLQGRLEHASPGRWVRYFPPDKIAKLAVDKFAADYGSWSVQHQDKGCPDDLGEIAKYIGNFSEDLLRCPGDDMTTHKAMFAGGTYNYSYTMNEFFESNPFRSPAAWPQCRAAVVRMCRRRR